ncbi:MAG: (Fe-S)-binding protein [Chloroflexota bacterium]
MKPTTVQLFATCIVETLRPEAGMAVVEVLERLGLAIEYPEGQTCCGQPAFNGGLWDDARAMARHTLDVLCRDVPQTRQRRKFWRTVCGRLRRELPAQHRRRAAPARSEGGDEASGGIAYKRRTMSDER